MTKPTGAQEKPQPTSNDKPYSTSGAAGPVVIVYSTYPDAAEAEAMGAALVDAGLVACANILPPMTSIYHWQGKRERATEIAMLMKTRASLAGRVTSEILARHSYDTPAVLVLPVESAAAAFAAWIESETSNA